MKTITTAARASPLSQAQVKEVEQLLSPCKLIPTLVQTTGDLDLNTSLRTLGKTDFFSKEVDQLVLSGHCRIAIHSAKDLPEMLPKGLKIVALTHGVDPADVLVLRPRETLDSLPENAVIATSSARREEAVRQLRQGCKFIDLRGTIDQRLEKLDDRTADGVVIAEAALLRLGLTHLNRIRLPGPSTPFQGQLAIVCQDNDHEMRQRLAPLDSRPTLYLGIEIAKPYQNRLIDHNPIIKTVPRALETIASAFSNLLKYTHIIFTSKVAVRLFFQHLITFGYQIDQLQKIKLIAVGKATAETIQYCGGEVYKIASEEHAEGVIKLLKTELKQNDNIFWPHSSLSRPLITDFLRSHQIGYSDCKLYDIINNEAHQKRDLSHYGEIIFTSPSTVDSFLQIYERLPADLWLTSIGQITKDYLDTNT